MALFPYLRGCINFSCNSIQVDEQLDEKIVLRLQSSAVFPYSPPMVEMRKAARIDSEKEDIFENRNYRKNKRDGMDSENQIERKWQGNIRTRWNVHGIKLSGKDGKKIIPLFRESAKSEGLNYRWNVE